MLTYSRDYRKFRTLSDDPAKAPINGLIHVQGSIVFVDRILVDMSMSMLGAMVPSQEQGQFDPAAFMTNIISTLSKSSFIPSSYMFHTDDGAVLAGIINDQGMTEPIASYYVRHGASGIQGVHLIGILENTATDVSLPASGFFAASRQFAESMSSTFLPAEALRVTPIAIFRQL